MRVTCVCPTTPDRIPWLPKAITCFLDQNYENRELLIVSDVGSVADVIPDDSRIRLLDLGDERRMIGAKRNLGCESADSEIICHWDDDDWYAPGRISDQVGRIVETCKAVTGYHSIRFTDGVRWWKNTNHPSWAYDSSLCYQRSFWKARRFDDINDGLEANFRQAAIREKQFVSVDAGDMMYATIHAGNTSARVIGDGWVEIEAPK